MLFTEFRFLLFLGVALLVYWSVPRNTFRKTWLTLCSYVFYAAWDWRFLGLIVFSTGLDYVASRCIDRSTARGVRRAWLLLSLVGNLGVLGFFKYYNFFVASGHDLLTWLGIPSRPAVLEIILPVGISFYTFQTLSYTLDVFRGKLRADKSLLNIAFFVAFFPQLVAGPIVRAVDFLPQLAEARTRNDVSLRAALVLFVVGFVKKVCIADNLAPAVDLFFSAPAQFAGLDALTAVVAYSAQIYCDFSGYSDMAIAAAGFFGYRLCKNFDFPYLATNVTEFWRRWHISLSTWLRDYLYISLGGNRRGTRRTYVNLLITMVLGGLWHGAAWTFVAWGALHGLALAVHKVWVGFRGSSNALSAKVVGWLATTAVVLAGWVLFRAESFGDALAAFGALFHMGQSAQRATGPRELFIIVVFTIGHLLASRFHRAERFERLPLWLVAAVCGAALSLAYMFGPVEYVPFLYFQF